MKCQKCGNEVRPNTRFCTTCGSPLEIVNPDKGRTFILYILGIGILLVGIWLGWVWRTLCVVKRFCGGDYLAFVIGLYAISFIVLPFLETIVWMNNKKIKTFRKFLRVSAFLVPLALSFFGCFAGMLWGYYIDQTDYVFVQAVLGSFVGSLVGGIAVIYIYHLTSQKQTPPADE